MQPTTSHVSSTTRVHTLPFNLEDYPSGYPQFAAIIGAHPDFSLSRRFTTSRARILLYKQDKVCAIENELDKLDRNETRSIFLGRFRGQNNAERVELLEKLDIALAEYDAIVKRTSEILALPPARDKYIKSLQNWLGFTGCISRDETSFLDKNNLLTTSNSGEDTLAIIESKVEELFVYFHERMSKHCILDASRDRSIFVFESSALKVVSQLIMTLIVVILLIVPLIAVWAVDNNALQIGLIMIFSTLFTLVLSGITKARPAEIFVAGVTYAALLTVFLSNSTKSN